MSMQTKSTIPEFSLPEAVKLAAPNHAPGIDYSVTSFSSTVKLEESPSRAAYFGIALCTKGTVELIADLEQYQLVPGVLIVMGPEVIRTWKGQSADYEEEALFFTERFFLETATDILDFKSLRFFQAEASKVISLREADSNLVKKVLSDIKTIIEMQTQRKDAIVRSYINILLNQVADLYDEYYPDGAGELATPAKMVSRFKKLLIEKHLHLRSVNGYADLLNVSAKHLSETVKEYTGKTASDWIHNILILEAKVRLKQTSLTIAQIANELNFNDASLFGKYFKRYAGCSPAVYRKG